ncbi:MAG: beta-N-acetylglucosaminidase domain-containing protein [bacterium]|nr:beta-N-acetylglucosaminidase domain-containing protein [bacterium]
MARTPLRGVVEGYYGRPWSGPARRDVIRFCGQKGLRTFVYGPKNDPYHRDRWREPYPDDVLADLCATVGVARAARVRFVWAVSPALDLRYTCADDRRALGRKLRQVARAGVRRFALFFDDVPDGLVDAGDVARFGGREGPAVARAHAALANGVDRWLRRRGLPGLALMVPTDYAGNACSAYDVELGRRLRRGIPIAWTGSGVFAQTITGAEARARAACLGAHPIVLWDNFPVNDTVLANSLHLGPFAGRDPDLADALAGHLLNPMTQPYASLVALGSAARYFAMPATYDAESAWVASLAELDPSGALRVLAEQTRSSALTAGFSDAPAWTAAVDAIETMLDGPDWVPGVAALEDEASRQRTAAAALRAEATSAPLRTEIAPWVDEMAAHAATAMHVVAMLRAMKPALVDLSITPADGSLHLTGRAVPPDPAEVARCAAALPGVPEADLGAYLASLGPITGADRTLCPALGLNVHGKHLYLLPWSLERLELVTGRNQYDRLLALVRDRHQAWLARQGAGSALSAAIDAAPLALDDDGRFDTTVPRTHGVPMRLVVTTAAGDATGLTLP